MNEMRKSPVADQSAWKAADIRDHNEQWAHTLSDENIREIEAALEHANSKDLKCEEITKEDFPLPTVQTLLKKILAQVHDGFGFCSVTGLPGENYTEDDSAKIFWGLGTYLGTAKSQNSHGHLVGHVVDMGGRLGEDRVRGYQTNQTLKFHTDRADMSALYCFQPAPKGGTTKVASSMAIHDTIMQTQPELLEHLYFGYPFMHMEEKGHAEPVRIPVYSVADNYLSCTLQADPVEKAIREQIMPVSEEAKKALALFHELACKPEFHLDFDLRKGDMLFNNNFTMLHCRTAFEDDPDPAKRRHLFRLWLAFDEPRPTAINFANYGGIKKKLEKSWVF